jgi:NADH dehydrogenase FAD-containing subunit
MKTHIVVLGAGYAGLVAAIRAKRRTGAEVTLVAASDRFVERIRLHQEAVGQAVPERRVGDLLEGTGVQFRKATVRALDPRAKRVELEGGEMLAWDYLIYALGSRIDLDAVPGVRAHALALDGALIGKLRARLQAGGRVVVVGSGLTGIEAATEAAETFPTLRVTLVSATALDGGYTRRGARHLRRTLEKLRIEIVEECEVREVRSDAVVTSKGELACEACIWSGGFIAPPLAWEAGLPVNTRGQVRTDGMLRVPAHPEIFVAGDAAAPEGYLGSPLHMACKTAMPMGAHAADQVAALIAGGEPRLFSFRDTGVCISLGRRNGLIQVRRPDGSPWFAITGRLAAWIKERVCRFTVWSVEREQRGKAYKWLHAPDAPKLLAPAGEHV